MERIRNSKTLSGDWVLAGGKVERVLKNALNEQFTSHAIEIKTLNVMTSSAMKRLDCPRDNMITYAAIISLGGIKTNINGICECYLNVYEHPVMSILYSTYMRVYWKVG